MTNLLSRLYHIRPQNRKVICISITIIFVTVIVVQSFNFFGGFYIDLLFFSGAFIWLPVILSYFFSFIVRNKEYELRTRQRCLVFLLAIMINVGISYSLLDPYSRDLTIFVYLITYPVQIAMILLFDWLLSLSRKYGQS